MSKVSWIIIFALTFAILAWSSYTAASRYLQFNRLDTQVQAQINDVEIRQKKSFYVLFLHLNYEIQNQSCASWAIYPYSFLNPLSADERGKELIATSTYVWVDSSQPEYISFSRELPIKHLFYFLTAFGVFLFFIYKFLKLSYVEETMETN